MNNLNNIYNNSITSLNVASELTDQEADALGAALSRNTSITNLFIEGRMTSQRAAAILRGIAGSRVKKLFFNFYVGFGDVENWQGELINTIRTNTTLQDVTVKNYQDYPFDGTKIFQSPNQRNRFNDIVEAIRANENSSLTQFEHNSFTHMHEDIARLREVLEENKGALRNLMRNLEITDR